VSNAAEQILAAVERWRAEEGRPLVVAIDGHGAAGKTTIAGEVEFAVEAMVVHTDDYFHEQEDNGDPRPMAQYYAWEALRERALQPAITWLREQPTTWTGALVILVEGVSSAAPALADLIDRTVFVQTPEPLRLERLHARVSEEEWDEEWLYAERLYFASRPPDSFDLVVSGLNS
jgi:uridine kinase